jgi:Zn-dependent protease
MRSRQSLNSGIQVGRVWGIPIYIHASWFVIFILLAWSMAVGILPQAHPELSIPALWLLGTATSLLFAVSVLLHELGHGYAALRNSIPVKNVTLFVFGGMAQIGQEPPTPGVEFAIAIAGPLVSLALGLFFGAVWLLEPNMTYLAAPSEWLARINLSLLAFNMIPGFPLDGGRVLRAILWHFSKRQASATRTTAITGQVIAFGFIGAGLYAIVTGNLYNGLWLAFIGWFLQSASSAGLAEDLRPRRADFQNTLYPSSQAGSIENALISKARMTDTPQNNLSAAKDSGAWLGGLPMLPGVVPALRHARWAKPRWPWMKDPVAMAAYDHLGKVQPVGASQQNAHSLYAIENPRRSRRLARSQRWLIATHSLQVRRGKFHFR